MKWGRKSGTATGDTKVTNKSEDHLKKVKLKKKRLSQMSNAELTELNKRLQLEKQYRDLTKTDMNPGLKFAKDILTELGKESIKGYIKTEGPKGAVALAKKLKK